MNYGDIKKSALKLINQFSIAGSPIASSYNNQADYLLRIPELVNEALIYLASGPKRLNATIYLDRRLADYDAHMYRFLLPEDCMGVKPGGLRVIRDKEIEYNTHYSCMGEDYILISDWVEGDLYLDYFRRPQLLPENPADDAPIDNSLNAQAAIPYYVAAHLVLQDDAYQYSVLNNEWLQRISMLEEPPHAHQERVADVYNLSSWEGY